MGDGAIVTDQTVLCLILGTVFGLLLWGLAGIASAITGVWGCHWRFWWWRECSDDFASVAASLMKTAGLISVVAV